MCSVMWDSLQAHGLWPTRILCPWDFPGRDTEVSCHFLLPGDLPNPGIEPTSSVAPVLAGEFFTPEPPGKSKGLLVLSNREAPCFTLPLVYDSHFYFMFFNYKQDCSQIPQIFMFSCTYVYGINSSKYNFWVNLYYSWIECSSSSLFSLFLTRRSSDSTMHLSYTVCGNQNQQGKCFLTLYIFTLKSIGPLPLH